MARVLNPVRILTGSGKGNFLTDLRGVDTSGFLVGKLVFLMTTLTINNQTKSVQEAEAGTHSLGAPGTLAFATPPAVSASGKTYMASNVMTWTAGEDVPPQTITHVAIGPDGDYGGAHAVIQLDEPIEIDQQGEVIRMAIETGFDADTFYLRARVLPLGE